VVGEHEAVTVPEAVWDPQRLAAVFAAGPPDRDPTGGDLPCSCVCALIGRHAI
jgi:hypothetical protein